MTCVHRFTPIVAIGLALVAGQATFALGPAAADPVVHMAWWTCGPSGSFEQVAVEEAMHLQIWVEGLEHGHQGYAFSLRWRTPDGAPLPDAWRLDAESCQPLDESGYGFRNQSVIGPNHGCWYGLAELLVAYPQVEVRYDESSGESTLDFELRYPPGQTTSFALRRYRMLLLLFNFEWRGTLGETTEPGRCGGLERPICFSLSGARYLDLEGAWQSWPLGNALVTSHGAGVPAPDCLPVPAAPTSWGWLKTRYH